MTVIKVIKPMVVFAFFFIHIYNSSEKFCIFAPD